jgi:hypothetical protein
VTVRDILLALVWLSWALGQEEVEAARTEKVVMLRQEVVKAWDPLKPFEIGNQKRLVFFATPVAVATFETMAVVVLRSWVRL